VTTISYAGTGTSQANQMTSLASIRVAQVEAPGLEASRSGRSFVGGTSLVAGGVVPVVDLPTTTGPFILFNSSSAGGGQKHLVVKRISCFWASGTPVATGFGLFAGVTPSVLATALTANGATNFATQCTRGTSPPTAFGFVDVAKTIPSGTAWMHLGGTSASITAAATAGPGYSVDLTAHPFIVPPLFALTIGALGALGTSFKLGFSVAWDEMELILP
jgi:hypothetical protein